jgi:hypothetical protein
LVAMAAQQLAVAAHARGLRWSRVRAAAGLEDALLQAAEAAVEWRRCVLANGR